MADVVTKEIGAENVYSDALAVAAGFVNVSVYGTFSATVYIQRSYDGGTTWLDVIAHTAATEGVVQEVTGGLYRAGVKTGGYTSGTAKVRLAH